MFARFFGVIAAGAVVCVALFGGVFFGTEAEAAVAVETSKPVAVAINNKTPEELRDSVVAESVEKFEDELEAVVAELISERENVGLTNDLLEELESEIKAVKLNGLGFSFNNELFIKEQVVEDMERGETFAYKSVESLVSDWRAELELEVEREAERERIRQEEARKEAERLAAEQAARASSSSNWSSASSSGGGSYSSGPSAYTLRFAGGGGQGLIDACVGAVNYGNMGLLAEHWHCGGAWFPQYAGAIINIPGLGTFRSTGVIGVVNQATASVMDVPGGYEYVYQTCLNGSPATTGFFGLVRI